jgi:16S rRNA (cytidine1402-2'-O)-methyltransferase
MKKNTGNSLGKLSVVATPVGNLGDFSARGRSTLLSADIIIAEDTRALRSLLPGEKVQAEVVRGDAITEGKVVSKILSALEDGKHVAMITDAGTPGISDPGYVVVKSIREALPDVVIETIPGPSALTAALSISGIPATPFTFLGFSPAKKGRAGFFQEISDFTHTVVLYESPHKFLKTLTELTTALGDSRIIFVGRELTKMHEEGRYGTIAEIASYYNSHSDKVRGEFVIVIKGK